MNVTPLNAALAISFFCTRSFTFRNSHSMVTMAMSDLMFLAVESFLLSLVSDPDSVHCPLRHLPLCHRLMYHRPALHHRPSCRCTGCYISAILADGMRSWTLFSPALPELPFL